MNPKPKSARVSECGCWLCDLVKEYETECGPTEDFYVHLPGKRGGKARAVATDHTRLDSSKRMRMLNYMRQLYGFRSTFHKGAGPHYFIEIVHLER